MFDPQKLDITTRGKIKNLSALNINNVKLIYTARLPRTPPASFFRTVTSKIFSLLSKIKIYRYLILQLY
uniref:Uncharacterized protein n=1 Tax=Lepeophtheirus salmonis TaxID=72036 RepID=A0A0K2TAP1_LEPSM